MQKIIGDRIRPADKKDPFGVEQALAAVHTALAIAEKQMASRTWAAGDAFTLADCAAAPPLFYSISWSPRSRAIRTSPPIWSA